MQTRAKVHREANESRTTASVARAATHRLRAFQGEEAHLDPAVFFVNCFLPRLGFAGLGLGRIVWKVEWQELLRRSVSAAGPGEASRSSTPAPKKGGASCEGPEPLRGAASNTSSRTLILWGASSHHEVFQRFTLTGSAQKRVAWREVGQAELAQNAVAMEACTSALVPPGHCQHPNTKLHSVGGGWGQVEGVRHGNREFGASPGSAGKLQVTITQDVRIGFGSTGL